MNKKIIVTCIFLIFIVLIIVCINMFTLKNVENKDNLYGQIEEYIKKSNENIKQEDMENFQTFVKFEKLGIKQNRFETYVYAWVLAENYYIKDNNLFEVSSTSIPYKFTIKDEKIVKDEVPEDGSYYAKSIKRIFPSDIREKIDNIDLDKLNKTIKEQVKKYYPDMNINSENISTISSNDYSNTSVNEIK